MTAVLEQIEETFPDPLYHSPIGLYDFQADGVARAYSAKVLFALWGMGIGKQAPISEPVLTPQGWITMGALRPGGHVIGRDGGPTEVLAIHPQTSRSVYRLTCSDGSWTRCGPDHLWTVRRRGKASRRDGGPRQSRWIEETLTTAELLRRGLTDGAGNRKFGLPITEPVRYPERELPVDAYALGVILGDAWISASGQVQLTTDKETIDALGVIGGRSSHSSDGIETLTTHAWAVGLRTLGLAGHRAWEKFVPEIYLRAPEQNRRALLAGLLDTDGHPIATGGVEYSTTSMLLAEAVVELTESLGGSARMGASRHTTYTHNGEQRTGRESWRVNVKLNEQPFRLARKMIRWIKPTKYPVARMISSIEPEPDEDCVCITVAARDGLYLTRHHIVTHNTHLAMATSALLFEDNLIDRVVVVAEANKIRDWATEDYPTFTDIPAGLYVGPKRAKLLEPGGPKVLVTTYETLRNDAVVFTEKKGSNAITGNGPLLTHLLGERVLVIYDEFSKLRNRGGRLYLAHERFLKRLRNNRKLTDPLRVLVLTGTPVERNVINYFNLLRIVDPDRAGTVEEFKNNHVLMTDDFGKVTRLKNIRPDKMLDDDVIPFTTRVAPLVMRKRKSDPDVASQFPQKFEEPPTFIDLHSQHYELLEEVRALSDGSLFGLERMLAGHPASVIHSDSEYARLITREVGEAGLRAIASAKTEALLDWALRLGEDSGVVFTFYGQSVLREIRDALRAAGYTISLNHGQMTTKDRQRSQDAFRAGDTQIFLTSDAGARGLNLGIGSALLHYEPSLTKANHDQRSDRIHRIDSVHELITIQTLIARGTADERAWQLVLESAQAAEDAVDFEVEADEESFLSAAQLRRITAMARRR